MVEEVGGPSDDEVVPLPEQLDAAGDCDEVPAFPRAGYQVSDRVREIIDRGIREGVAFEMNWRTTHDVTKIRWHPGDPNPLAAAIIKHVDKPIPLVLDSHEFVIMPADQYDGELPEYVGPEMVHEKRRVVFTPEAMETLRSLPAEEPFPDLTNPDP